MRKHDPFGCAVRDLDTVPVDLGGLHPDNGAQVDVFIADVDGKNAFGLEMCQIELEGFLGEQVGGGRKLRLLVE